MTDTVPSLEDVTVVTDPGEINRDQHRKADRFVIHFGNTLAWLFPLLIVGIVTQVIIRKMGNNQAWLDDAQWWMYGIAMMAGFAYAVTTNSHVRVDIFHANFSRKKQARIEVIGLGWLFLPFLMMMFDVLIHYSWSAILAREGSSSPNGLHGLYLLKSALPLMFGLTIIATISALKRNLARLARPSLHALLVAGLPAFLFAAQRLAHYAMYWVIRFTNSDIKPRKILKEPVMENALWMGFVLVACLMIYSLMRARKKSREGV